MMAMTTFVLPVVVAQASMALIAPRFHCEEKAGSSGIGPPGPASATSSVCPIPAMASTGHSNTQLFVFIRDRQSAVDVLPRLTPTLGNSAALPATWIALR